MDGLVQCCTMLVRCSWKLYNDMAQLMDSYIKITTHGKLDRLIESCIMMARLIQKLYNDG